MWSEILELLGEFRSEIRNIDRVLVGLETIISTLARTGNVSLDDLLHTIHNVGGDKEVEMISPEV